MKPFEHESKLLQARVKAMMDVNRGGGRWTKFRKMAKVKTGRTHGRRPVRTPGLQDDTPGPIAARRPCAASGYRPITFVKTLLYLFRIYIQPLSLPFLHCRGFFPAPALDQFNRGAIPMGTEEGRQAFCRNILTPPRRAAPTRIRPGFGARRFGSKQPGRKPYKSVNQEIHGDGQDENGF
jgi:hypothetical protein